MLTRLEAERRAKKLVKLLGRGWKRRVYENMGWHFCACALDGHLTVRESDVKGKYWVMFSIYSPGFGSGEWQNSKCYTDPRKAVYAQIKLVRKYLDFVVERTNDLFDFERRLREGT